MNTKVILPESAHEKNSRLNQSSLLIGAVSGAAAGILGLDPLGVGLLVGGGAWLFGKAQQVFRK